MQKALRILAGLTLLGCSEEITPYRLFTPSDPPASLTFLWGMVVEDSGICIPGATVTVVGGQALGQRITQKTPCDAWAYDGGFVFQNLTAGVAMTLRVSALGYAEEERTVVPSTGPQTAVIFAPPRIQ
jgi:hypothetical protein